VVVRDEADLLAVRLLGDRQTAPAGVLPYRDLRPIADRKQGACELILAEREQKVRLILAGIHAALQDGAARGTVALDARGTARGDGVGAEAARAIGQRRKLQIAVAVRAGQRRP